MSSSSSLPTENLCSLAALTPGESAIIDRLGGSAETQLRLLELGVAPGEEVILCYVTPLGGPMEIELMSYRLAIRRSDAEEIWVLRGAAPTP